MALYGICREEGRCVCGLCERAGKKYARGYAPPAKLDSLPAPRSDVTCLSCNGQHGGHFHWCQTINPPEPPTVTHPLNPPYCGWCGTLRHQGKCRPALVEVP